MAESDDVLFERQQSSLPDISIDDILNDIEATELSNNSEPRLISNTQSANIYTTRNRKSNRSRTRSPSPLSPLRHTRSNRSTKSDKTTSTTKNETKVPDRAPFSLFGRPSQKAKSDRAQTPPSPKKQSRSTSSWSINLNPFASYTANTQGRVGLVPAVSQAAQMVTNVMKNINDKSIPDITDTNNHLDEVLTNWEDQIVPYLMKTMKMIQDLVVNINRFIKFLEVVVVVMCALIVNYFYVHTEFVLAVIVILVFSMDFLRLWSEEYYESIDDKRIYNGLMIKVTMDKKRMDKCWKESGLGEMSVNVQQVLGKYGQIIEKNREYKSVFVKCETGKCVWIPIKACIV